MPDIYKAIKGLECCTDSLKARCPECPYYPCYDQDTTSEKLLADALELLNGQEPVEPKKARWIRLEGMAPPEHHGHKICSACECMAPYDPLHMGREMLSPYCPGCGAKMEVQNAAEGGRKCLTGMN